MKLLTLGIVTILAAGTAFADEPVGFARGTKLLDRYHCQTCHSIDRTRAGPSLRDIAKKYASDPHARSELSASILNGSSGVWGGPVPMPPTEVPAKDLKSLVEWILSLGQY